MSVQIKCLSWLQVLVKAAQLTARHKIFLLVTAAKAGLQSTINQIYAKAVFFQEASGIKRCQKNLRLDGGFFMNYSAAVASVVSVLSQFPQWIFSGL